MVVFLLFLILVVLLYATGLLPGVMKIISGFFACVLLFVAAGLYGWPMVIGGFATAIALAGFGVWLSAFSSSPGRRANSNHSDIHRQLERANAEQKRKREEREHEKQRVMQEQIDATASIPAFQPSPPVPKTSVGDFENPVEVFFNYQDQRDPAPRKQYVSIQRVSTKDGRVFLKAQCLKSSSMKMFMVDRIKGDIASTVNGQLVSPRDYTRVEDLRGAIFKLL